MQAPLTVVLHLALMSGADAEGDAPRLHSGTCSISPTKTMHAVTMHPTSVVRSMSISRLLFVAITDTQHSVGLVVGPLRTTVL